MKYTSGKITSAASRLCTALKTIFSIATQVTGSGDITRSWISRVAPISIESGNAVAMMP